MASTKGSIYRILRRSVMTEKSAIASSIDNGVVFEVHPRANKQEIKKAVESLFDVKVKSVRTLNCSGKVKRVGVRQGQRRSIKKAFVSLREGSINLIEGL